MSWLVAGRRQQRNPVSYNIVRVYTMKLTRTIRREYLACRILERILSRCVECQRDP